MLLFFSSPFKIGPCQLRVSQAPSNVPKICLLSETLTAMWWLCVQFVRQSVGTSPSSYCGRTDLLLFNGLQTKRFIRDTSSVAHRLHLKFSISSQPSELGNNRSRQHVWSLSYSWWCWACYNKYFCTHLGVTFFFPSKSCTTQWQFHLGLKVSKKVCPHAEVKGDIYCWNRILHDKCLGWKIRRHSESKRFWHFL